MYKTQSYSGSTEVSDELPTMGTGDPTYPLYPIVCFLAAVMSVLVLLTSFIRQSWNIGVIFLCFWLFLETLTEGINAVIWRDNAEIKLYAYCNIGEFSAMNRVLP